jgi:hypothetical protein
MKIPNFKTFTLLIAALAWLPLSAQTFTKEYQKEFSIRQGGDVTLSNRYGKLDIKTWNQDRVEVNVVVTIETRNENTADRFFERIDVEFSEGANSCSAETKIESRNDWRFWENRGDNKYRIDYEVSIPATVNLNVANRYGDTYVPSIQGDLDLEIRYGGLNVQDIGGDVDIELRYGKGTCSINEARSLSGEVRYSKLKVERTGDVNLAAAYADVMINEGGSVEMSTSYSDLQLGSIRSLDYDGRYDDFRIGRADVVRVETRYSDIVIDELMSEGDFETRYGDVKVMEVGGQFSGISADGDYTDYLFDMDGSNFRIDVSSKYTNIRYPSGLTVEDAVEKSSDHDLRGYVGSKTSGLIRANLSYGSLKIQ